MSLLSNITDIIYDNKTKSVVIFGIIGIVLFIIGFVNFLLLGQKIEEDCKNEVAKKTCYDKTENEYLYLYIYYYSFIGLGLLVLLFVARLAYLKYREG